MQPEPKFKEGERVKYTLPWSGPHYGSVVHFHQTNTRIYAVKRDGEPVAECVYEYEMENLDANG